MRKEGVACETVSVGAGYTVQLSAEVNATGNPDKTISWETSNPKIATVDANGLVTGVDFGDCGKYLLDYWRDSYDNRQNYRQVEEIAFPEKDTQEEETEPNEDNPTTEIDDFDYQSLLDENADCRENGG